MPVGFGKGSQNQGTEGSGGTRKDLPEGTYRIKHKFTMQTFKNDDVPSLRLELRKADEPDCVMWLSGGKLAGNAAGLKPSADGKALEGSGQLSARTRAAQYFTQFQEKANLPDDKMTDLSTLDEFECQIALIPNPSAMASPGSKIPVLLSVNPPKAAPVKAEQESGPVISSGGNGQADDVDLGFTTMQEAGLRALTSYLTEHGTLSLQSKAGAVAALKPYTGAKKAIDQAQIATTAITPAVLASEVGFVFDAETKIITRL